MPITCLTKLLKEVDVAMLYDCEYIGEVEMLCSDNLTSFCSYYNLLGKFLGNSLLNSLDGASTSIVDTYIIDQLGSVQVNCKRSIDVPHQRSHSALVARQIVGALGSVNLSHHDKNTHLSILWILWQYDPLTDVTSMSDQSLKGKVRMDNPQTMKEYYGSNVVHLRILIDDMPLLIPIIREAILLISNIHMSLYTGWIVQEYTYVVLGGVETLTNCFIYPWNLTWNSMAVFLHQSFGLLWHKYIAFLDHSPPVLLGSSDKVAPNARELIEIANSLIGNLRSYVCLLSDKMAYATILPLLSELSSSEQFEPGSTLLLPFKFKCKIGNFSRQLNLELVTSPLAQILEWTGCVDYLKGWTLLSPQLQEAKGTRTLAGQIERLSISFVGTPGSSHPVPAVHDFLRKEPYVAPDIEQHTLRNCPLQFGNSSRHALAVNITSHGLEKEGTNVELGHDALSFLQIFPSIAPKVDIINIRSMYFILVDDVKLLSKSLCFGIITWLLYLGKLIWTCFKIGCMATHSHALVALTELIVCLYSERAFELAAKMALTLASITIAGDILYIEENSGAATRVCWNDTYATKFVLNVKFVPIPQMMMLYSNLEDKVLFEGGRIVMNITKMEDPCEKCQITFRSPRDVYILKREIIN